MKYFRLLAISLWLCFILTTPLLPNFVNAQANTLNRTLPHWSPDGGYLLFASWIDPLEIEVWLSDSDGSNQKRVFEAGEIEFYLSAWTEQSDAFVFAFHSADGSSSMYLYSIEAQGITSIYSQSDATILSSAISPEGSHIAFVSRTNGEYSVSVVDLTDLSHRYLTSSSVGHWAVTWLSNEIIMFSTSDGLVRMRVTDGIVLKSFSEPIVYEIDNDGDGNLLLNGAPDQGTATFDAYALFTDVDEIVNITSEDFEQVLGPRWLDDNEIVVSAPKNGDWDIWKINLDSKQVENLTPHFTAPATQPDVNHSTNQIAFTAVNAEGGGVDIWIMDADGSNLHRLSDQDSD